MAAVDLLLVLLGAGPACSLNAPVCPPWPPSTCCSFCWVAEAGLLAERAGLPAVAAVDLLLVLLRAAVAGLLAERAGLPAVPAAVDLLLVLLRAAVAGLLIERAGLPAGGPVHLLLVLLRSAVAGLLIERAGLPARGAVDLLLVLLGGLRGHGLCAHLLSYPL